MQEHLIIFDTTLRDGDQTPGVHFSMADKVAIAQALEAFGVDTVEACPYGCLGLGDCEVVCTFDAIHMSLTLLPVVDEDKCTACGDCVEICPKGLFELVPVNRQLFVRCKSLLEGDGILENCQVACTACGRCAADAPEGLIVMKNNLPVINDEMAHNETEIATLRCPTGAIVWLNH